MTEEKPHEETEINEHSTKEENITPPPNKTRTQEQTQRRGERNRAKPNLYGHNILVTQLSSKAKQNEAEMPEKK